MAAPDEPSGLILESVERHACERCGVEMDVLGVEPFKSFNCPECGAPFVVPARLGPFLLVSQIGRGGMGGVVFLARDELLDRNVAIKIMPASVGVNEELVATFRREAQAAARLNHPNIAQVYSFGQENGQPYIVMELLSGSSLDKLIEADGQLDEGFVVHIGLQVAQGLRAADEASLTHGDIKPENILFDDKMNAKVVDFGISSFVNQASEGIWGTPYYIAPERLLRMKPDARSDMYCLGGTLYHALTGRPPFDGRTPAEVVRARLEIDPLPVSELRRGVREEVESTVMRMLRREPGVRHPTYASLISDLTKAAKVVPYGGNTGTFGAVKTGKKIILTGTKARAARETGGVTKSSGQIRIYAKPHDSQRLSDTARRTTGSIATPKVSGGGASTVRRLIKGAVWLLILGGLVAGGAWLYMSAKERKNAEFIGRKEKLALAEQQQKIPALWAALQQSLTNVNRHAANASAYTGTVVRAVQVVLNETLELPPPPAPPVVAAPSTNVVAADTNAPAVQGTNVVAAGTNESVAAIVPPLPLAAEPPPKEPKEPEVPDPEIKALGKKALAAVREILNARDSVQRLVSEAEALREAAVSATASTVVLDRVNGMAENVKLCEKEEVGARKRLEDAKALTLKVDSLRKKFEQDQEQVQKAKADREKAEQEAKEAEAAAARKKALIESETASAVLARSKAIAHMKEYTFGKAVEELKTERAGYQTDEGKVELDKSIERYQRMAALHRFIVGRLAAEPLSWGWISGRAGGEDVTGADEQGVKTKTRVYPWSEVSIRQYLHFFRQYKDDKNIRAREAVDNYVAAAIFCMENVLGSDNQKMVEGATNLAREFVDRAKAMLPSIQPDIKRLLPIE